MEGIHFTIFAGLFPDFAGRLRGPSPRHIPIEVEFGNFHGTRHVDAPAACQELFAIVRNGIDQLAALRQLLAPADFDSEVLKLAAYTHCELIRIHPFLNGNGRTARACINYFAWRYGLRPIAITRPKGEYLDANRTWLQLRIIDHMVDFLRPEWRRQ